MKLILRRFGGFVTVGISQLTIVGAYGQAWQAAEETLLAAPSPSRFGKGKAKR
ncbi:MAG TPA: hypothetical protein VGL82_06495 [Bryobacteraceae bacterium]